MTDIYMDSSSPQCSKDVKSPASTISTENNMRLEFEHEYKNLHFDDDVNTLVEDEEYDNESFSCSYEEQKDIVQHNESDDGTSKVYHQEKSSNLVKRKFEDCFHENDSEELDNTENSKNSSYHEICDEHNESKNIGKKLILEKNFGELNDLKPKPSNLDSVNISAYCPPNISATRNFGATAVFQSIPNVLAQPIIDISWRGRCGMICNLQHITLGITAHLSNTASLKVHGATSVLPQELIFKLVPKQEVWPKAFEASPPMTADIALYFFPSEERDEKAYNTVLEKMINLHSAWTFNINNNLDLVLFSSQELRQEHWRFQRKYYMWGMFKPTQNSLVASSFTIRSNSLCGKLV
uniref:AIPP2-like SPOC-like domain-containing protein n=1 Tax=Chenopodium quinoa TaxID=63459 RepID=A0A803KX52_CHEQI